MRSPFQVSTRGRRELLENLSFFTGYGVETGHLIDIVRLYGLNFIGQCDLDVRVHRNQSIDALRSMSYRILKILLQRADDMGRIEIFQDISDSLQVITGVKHSYSMEKKKVWGTERPPMITIHEYRDLRNIEVDQSSGLNTNVVKPLPYTASLMFHKELIIPRLKGVTKAEVINELIAAGQSRIMDPEEVKKALKENWEVVPTPINKNMVFFHAFGDFADDIVATTNFDLNNRWARIRFNNEYTDNLTDKNLDSTAFHEVCELLLVSLRNMGEYGYSVNMVDEEIHKVIRTLENVILK